MKINHHLCQKYKTLIKRSLNSVYFDILIVIFIFQKDEKLVQNIFPSNLLKEKITQEWSISGDFNQNLHT